VVCGLTTLGYDTPQQRHKPGSAVNREVSVLVKKYLNKVRMYSLKCVITKMKKTMQNQSPGKTVHIKQSWQKSPVR